MAREVWDVVLIPGVCISAGHTEWCHLLGAFKTLELLSVLLSLNDLILPHFFSHPDWEKLEVQALREDWRPEADPGQQHTAFTGFPHTMMPSSAKLQGQNQSHIQQTQVDFYLDKSEMPMCWLRLKIFKVIVIVYFFIKLLIVLSLFNYDSSTFYYYYYYYFGVTWVWTQGFTFLRQVLYCLSHASSPFLLWLFWR
jgi:hypothetical protein